MSDAPERNAGDTYDVFLCHNSVDKSEVESIGEKLLAAGLKPWLDKWDLRPGFDWIDAIEEQIDSVRSVAVFVGGDEISPWQKKEMKSFLRRQARKEMPVIPVLLPSCDEEPDLPSFLEDFTWVDFRTDPKRALEQLIFGITGEKVDTTPRPTVLIAPALARKPRKKLIEYCRNAGLRVLGDGLYPEEPDALRAAFQKDIEQSNLFVQVLCEDADRSASFQEGKERWFIEAATEALTAPRVVLWRPPDVEPEEADSDSHREFITHPDVQVDLPSEIHEKIVTKVKQAFEIGAASTVAAEKRFAMVKFSHDDSGPTQELMNVLSTDNVLCVPSENGVPIVDAFRLNPALDAIIVVLGECSPMWKEQRGFELVSFALRDDAPLRFYYHPGGHSGHPPLSDPQAIDIVGRDQINILIDQIRGKQHAHGDGE
jgi:hypothetical protein